jgi:hypothetical protein
MLARSSQIITVVVVVAIIIVVIIIVAGIIDIVLIGVALCRMRAKLVEQEIDATVDRKKTVILRHSDDMRLLFLFLFWFCCW